MGVTPYGEYFIPYRANSDVMVHMVWQPYWIKGKRLDIIFSKTAQQQKKSDIIGCMDDTSI